MTQNFADTYYFPKGVNAQMILSAMVNRSLMVFRSEWKQRAKDMNLSVHQVLTLASVIEKETGLASERPIISSVFHNRLKIGMRLDSDPTVIYGIENFNGNITRKNLETPTPYNTYKIYGLPPGPIASPGASAIEAALYPSDTDFLYFVAKGDGSHQFSKSLEEHRQAVKKYQLRKNAH
ncbi:MAG: endolytic transglycosylase MltG [Desulfobacteraceae bacterium]|nr:endolytic transglycosylase MltG [Desulfobacteraceae bacterium]